jgi:peptidoglycan/LPS O-acetylase OafA/YrhL
MLHSILRTSSLLLSFVALIGMALAVMRFGSDTPPAAWLPKLHGLLATAGVTLLVYAWATDGLPVAAGIALALFLIAAAGGLAMNLVFRGRGRALPEGLVFAHLSVAALGLILLVAATMGVHS